MGYAQSKEAVLPLGHRLHHSPTGRASPTRLPVPDSRASDAGDAGTAGRRRTTILPGVNPEAERTGTPASSGARGSSHWIRLRVLRYAPVLPDDSRQDRRGPP